MTVGDNIRKLREAHDLTQSELADQLGVTRETVVKWEINKFSIRDSHVIKLCEIFGIEPDDIRSEAYGLASNEHVRVIPS